MRRDTRNIESRRRNGRRNGRKPWPLKALGIKKYNFLFKETKTPIPEGPRADVGVAGGTGARRRVTRPRVTRIMRTHTRTRHAWRTHPRDFRPNFRPFSAIRVYLPLATENRSTLSLQIGLAGICAAVWNSIGAVGKWRKSGEPCNRVKTSRKTYTLSPLSSKGETDLSALFSTI